MSDKELEIDDEFNVGSDEEFAGLPGVVSVANFPPRTEAGKLEEAKILDKDNILNLNEAGIHPPCNRVEIQQIIADPATKDDLIKTLLGMETQKKPAKKAQPIPAKGINKKPNYEGRNDPTNPENETDFKKAYAKVWLR